MTKVLELTLDQILKSTDPKYTEVSRDTLTRRCQTGEIKARKVGIQWVVKMTIPNKKAIAKRERAPKKPRDKE